MKRLQRLRFAITITFDARDRFLDLAVMGGCGRPVSMGLVLDVLELARRRVVDVERAERDKSRG